MRKKLLTFIGAVLVFVLCFAFIPACGNNEKEPEPEEPVSVGLTISKTELTMNINTEEQLTASTNDDSLYTFTWSSSDTEVATVTGGLVSAKGAGTATITVGCRKKGSAAVLESKTCKVTVVDHHIALDKTSILILPDTGISSVTIQAQVEGSNDPVVWTSSDESVATVDGGVVTARKTGQAVITATSGDLTNTCRITVANKISVEVGGKASLASSLSSPVWTSSDDGIVKIENGEVTGVGLGTTTVTATSGDEKQDYIVTVAAKSDMKEYTLESGKKADAANNPGVWNYLLESDQAATSEIPVYKNGVLAIDITSIGESGSNFAYLRYQPDNVGGIYYNVSLYMWAGADGIVAINGVDTEIKAGANVLDMTYTSKKPSAADTFQFKFRTATAYIISVMFEESEPETPLTLDKTSLELIPGATAKLEATYEEDSVFEWSTSDAKVATVNDGLVTAVAEGTATITVKSGDKTADCIVTVSSEMVTLSESFVTLYLEDDEDGTAHDHVTLSAQSSSGGQVEWATSNEGVVTVEGGVIKAVSEGWATITASTEKSSAKCIVFVAATAASYTMTEGKNADVPNNPGIWFWAGNKGSGVQYDNGTITVKFEEGHSAVSGDKTFMVRYMPYIEGDYNISFNLKIDCSDNIGETDIITVTLKGDGGVMELTAAQLAQGVECSSSLSEFFQLKVSGIAAEVTADITISDIVLTPVV